MCLETFKSAFAKMEKNLKRKTKRSYTESDATGQLEPERKDFYYYVDMKNCARGSLRVRSLTGQIFRH